MKNNIEKCSRLRDFIFFPFNKRLTLFWKKMSFDIQCTCTIFILYYRWPVDFFGANLATAHQLYTAF